VLTCYRGSVPHSYSDSDVLYSVPRPNHRTTTRPYISPNFMLASNNINIEIVSTNEEANSQLFGSSTSSATNYCSPQNRFENVASAHELNSIQHLEMHAVDRELDTGNSLWGDYPLDHFISCLDAAPFVPQQVTIPPTSQAALDSQPNPAISSLPQQATSQSSQAPSFQNIMAQPPRHACGINNCPKSYKRRSDRQRHRLHHSLSRDYACRFGTCKRASQNGFKRKDHLKQHLRQVHGVSQ